MKNVCFFNSTSFWGGGEKAHLEYAENFIRKGYNVWIVCSKGSVLGLRAFEKEIRTYSIPLDNLSFLNPFKRKRFVNFFKENKIDTVFLNSSPDLKIGGLTAKEAGVKNIVYMRGLAAPVKNSVLNRYLLTKVITHPVTNSLDTKKVFLTNLQSVLPKEQVHVIYRGINFKEWDAGPVSQLSLKEGDEIILGNVGRLTEQKGQDQLIEVVKILRNEDLNFKLIIAGSGPMEAKLQESIYKNKLEGSVKLIGFQDDIKSFLNAIDIFVFPSLWEGFGFALVEAMAEKKVPVAFDLTSNPEIITNGENGFLVEPQNFEEFADKIKFLVNNPDKRKEMGEAARKSVIDRFSFDKIMQDWENLLG